MKLSFEEHMIMESLDKPWELSDDTDSSMGDHIRKHLTSLLGEEPARYKFFTSKEGGGHLVEFHNKGAMEVHHTDEYGFSGALTGKSNTPNTGFVATMLHRATKHLDKGFPVRIVGATDTGLFGHYERLGRILAKKHGVTMSNPVDHAVLGNPTAKAKAFTLTRGHYPFGKEISEQLIEFNKRKKQNGM